MALDLRAVGAVASGNGTSVVINVPAEVVDNDILLAVVSVDSWSGTISAPAGWTLLQVDGLAFCEAFLYWRLASSEPASHAWTLSSSADYSGVILAFSGGDSASPIDASAVVTDALADSVDAPSVTTTRDGNMVVVVIAGWVTKSGTYSFPAGYTVQSSGTAQDDWATKIQATAGATGTITCTNSGDPRDAVAFTVALNVESTVSKTSSDSGTPSASETASISVSLGSSDSGMVAAADSGSVITPKSGSDSGSPAASESGTPRPLGSEGEVIGAAESGSLSATGGSADGGTPGSLESGSLSATDASADSEAVNAQESASLSRSVMPIAHGPPVVAPALVIFDRPGGVQISADLARVAGGLSWATAAIGGFKDAEWQLERGGIEEWADLRSYAHVEIRDRLGLIWEGRLQPVETNNEGQITCRAEGYFFTSAKDERYRTSSSSNRNPDDALREIFGAKAPLIDLNRGTIEPNGSFTIDFSDQQYQGITPRDYAEQISAFGDSEGNLRVVAVWDDRALSYRPLGKDAVIYTFEDNDGLYTAAPDPDQHFNVVWVQYRAADGSVAYSSTHRDDESIRFYGIEKEFEVKENDISSAMAESLAATELKRHKELQTRVSIRLKRIRNAAGAPVPVGRVRAGDVIRIPGIGDRVIMETRYSHESGELEIIPEYGWTEANPFTRLGMTEKKAAAAGNYQAGTTGTTLENRDAARSDASYLKADTYDKATADGRFANTSGDTFSGPVTMSAGATVNNGLVGNGGQTFSGSLSAGPIDATNVSVDALGVGRPAPAFSGILECNSATIFGTLGTTSTADLEFLQVDQTAQIDGTLNVTGTKNAVIYEPDGTITRFAAMEGEITRFVVAVDLSPAEAALVWGDLGPVIVGRLPAAFVRNVEPQFTPVVSPVLGADGVPSGYRCLVIAPARADLPCQMEPFGHGGESIPERHVTDRMRIRRERRMKRLAATAKTSAETP